MAYKLTYFNLRGRAEPIRLLFAVAGQQFEDVRIEREQWPAVKESFPFGQIPVLQVGDKTITQTATIARFLARRFNLAGADEFAVARCEELVDAMTDVQIEWAQLIYLEQDETKKPALKKNLQEKTLPKYLSKFEKIQKENGGNFLVGPSITWADVWIAYTLELYETTVDANTLDKYPNLKKLKETVYSIPNVKAYLPKRPTT